jgi:hypothetical protein
MEVAVYENNACLTMFSSLGESSLFKVAPHKYREETV